MKDEGVTAEMMRDRYVGWRRFLAYFERLARPERATKSTRSRWRREMAKLDEQLDEIGERRRALSQKLTDSCSHAIDDQVVHSYRGEDTLGNLRSESDTEYTITCRGCRQRLASFHAYDEQQVAREGGKRLPWEKRQ